MIRVKKFIKNIEYSKDKITINLFYPDEGICPNFNSSNSLVPLDTNPFALHNTAGRPENFLEISQDCMPSAESIQAKKRPELLDAVPAGSSSSVLNTKFWPIILPNTIHFGNRKA